MMGSINRQIDRCDDRANRYMWIDRCDDGSINRQIDRCDDRANRYMWIDRCDDGVNK